MLRQSVCSYLFPIQQFRTGQSISDSLCLLYLQVVVSFLILLHTFPSLFLSACVAPLPLQFHKYVPVLMDLANISSLLILFHSFYVVYSFATFGIPLKTLTHVAPPFLRTCYFRFLSTSYRAFFSCPTPQSSMCHERQSPVP